jgi:glyoxylase-like metal-dependent hydrolase (beta-lactamase superfamily II)
VAVPVAALRTDPAPPAHDVTDFLGNLARAGVQPKEVDIVVNTHLHADHVGWNTRLDGRDWVPTFPNARYLLPRPDFEFGNPLGDHQPKGARSQQNVFEDSILPVHQAEKTILWEDGYDIDAHLRLQPSPGHTPGSSVLRLTSGSDRAVFIGDPPHTALQLVRPEHNSCFEQDEDAARATRRRILGWAADNSALVFPTHLGGHGAAQIQRDGAQFAIKDWAPFDHPRRSTTHD